MINWIAKKIGQLMSWRESQVEKAIRLQHSHFRINREAGTLFPDPPKPTDGNEIAFYRWRVDCVAAEERRMHYRLDRYREFK